MPSLEARLAALEAQLRPQVAPLDQPWAFADAEPRPLRDLETAELDWLIDKLERGEVSCIDLGDGVCRVVPTPAGPLPEHMQPHTPPLITDDEYGVFE